MLKALRLALFAGVGLGGLILIACLAAGWYYAGRIDAGALRPDRAPKKLDLRVVSAGEGRIVLEPASGSTSEAWRKDGIWGIEWPDDYARAGRIIELDQRQVTRELTSNQTPPSPGTRVRLDSFAYPPDPLKALSLPYRDVRFKAPLGDLPAWYFAGERDTWVIGVHGKGATPAETLRLLSVTTRLGFPGLAISYRNDEGAPVSANGRYGYGLDEWQDLEAAVAYARDNGARRIVLAGFSMGGGIVMAFLQRSTLAPLVAGVVLDAPLLDFGATISFAAERRHVPAPIAALAKEIVARRYDVDWRALDYLRDAQSLRAPILLFHGDADTTVPIATSEALGRARPDLVELHRVAGATHVRSWNVDPAGYETAVRAFLERLGR